jgi:SAM-dependent methyltransferase
LVFGRDLIEANQVFSAFALGKKSLIIGGGDGVAYRDWDESCAGEYWDTSLKMTELANENLTNSKIEVRSGKWPGIGKFDAIFLPFVLDTMHDSEIQKIIFQISHSLNPGGKVILSDFFPPHTFLQHSIQLLMITGFRIFAKHPRTDLPDFSRFFEEDCWKILDEKTWRKGWIRARVYERIDSLGH